MGPEDAGLLSGVRSGPRAPERRVFVSSAEDLILRKLDWYRRGGGVSDRQWRDVLGVLKVQAERLDLEHLRHWAAALDLSGLSSGRSQSRGSPLADALSDAEPIENADAGI